MKTVILAGGFGTRISEETHLKPKPMIEIGGYPILWHIMKLYSSYGFNDFVICLGYKGYLIKEYFANYFLHMTDVTIDITKNKIEVLQEKAEPWKITLIDTGATTMTGGRIKRIQKQVENEAFFLTYGDGLSNVNIPALLKFHRENKVALTLTAIQPPGRFGSVVVNKDSRIASFKEKPKGDGAWSNGGFFVCEPSIFDKIEGDQTIWEQEPLEELAQEGQLAAFKHEGFWQPMDTLRDKNTLEDLWQSNRAPWKIWKD
jgi:glucose-1-phosphate cytidylyltransferase